MTEETRFDQVRLITRKKLNLSDYIWDIGSLLLDIEDGFNLEVSETRVLSYDNSIWNAITFETSLDRIEYTRTVYSFLDFLRDMGGLFSALGPFFGSAVAIL